MTDVVVDVHTDHPFPTLRTSPRSISPIQWWNKENWTEFGVAAMYDRYLDYREGLIVQEEKTLRLLGRRDW